MKMFVRHLVAGFLLLAAAASPLAAQTGTERDAVADAYAKSIAGPTSVTVGDIASLQIPKDFVFVPGAVGRYLMHGIGNAGGEALFGLVLPANAYGGWAIAVAVADTGYVSNETLGKLDFSDVLAAIRSSTRRGNAERMKLGSGPIEAGDWVEPPRHDAAAHRVTTAVRIYESGPSTGSEDSIELAVTAFGRSKAITVALFGGLGEYGRQRPAFEQIAAGLHFLPGHRALDFVPGTDAVASHVVDVVFGGRTQADIAHEAAEEAAERARIAALPPKPDRKREMQLMFFGLLGVVSLLLVVLALRGGRSTAASVASDSVERAMRTAGRRS
jgi:uncharacterized membrane-anchored protein